MWYNVSNYCCYKAAAFQIVQLSESKHGFVQAQLGGLNKLKIEEVRMRKYSKFLVIALILVLAMGSFAACGGGEEEPAEEPAATKALWVDEYAKCVASGEKDGYANYDALMQPMRDFQTAEGAQYIYTVIPAEEGALDGSYLLAVDASEEPEEWGIDYGFEIQFKEAAEGEVAAARSAWQDNDEGTAWCWSAFAPVKDADGNVVAIVGIDYPAELMKDFPEWDRDNDKWNGYEEEWPTDMPEELVTFTDECKDRVAKLAEQLSALEIEVK